MSEEKKDEVLGQEKELDESELEAVSGGKGSCFDVDNVGNNPCLLGDEPDKPSVKPSLSF